jgi:hypothetical protein
MREKKEGGKMRRWEGEKVGERRIERGRREKGEGGKMGRVKGKQD